MVVKGMLGEAWTRHVTEWGLEEGEVWRLKEGILRAVQRVLPEIETVAHEVEKELEGVDEHMDEDELARVEEAMCRQESEKWVGDEGKEARERVERLGKRRKLRWAHGVLSRGKKRCELRKVDTNREAARRRSEAKDGRQLDKWIGRVPARRKPKWQTWWPQKAVRKRQTVLDFGLSSGGEAAEHLEQLRI